MPPTPAQQQFSGRASTASAWLSFIFYALLLSPLLFFIYQKQGAPLLILLLAALAFLCHGARWQVTINTDGITLKRWHAWIFPRKPQKSLLDAIIQPYQSWESDWAEGLTITDYLHTIIPEICFGPDERSPDHAPLLTAMQDALSTARTHIQHTENLSQPRPRHPIFHTPDAFDPRTATWHQSLTPKPLLENRIREIRSLQPTTVANIKIPAHSTFTFNTRLTTIPNNWMDPRRPDILDKIQISATTTLPNLGEISAGSTLLFTDSGELFILQEASPRHFQSQGFTLDSHHPIHFHNHLPSAFHLAKPHQLTHFQLPAQTHIEQSFGMYNTWRATLIAPLKLPQITLLPGDHLYFDATRKYPVYATHQHDFTLHNKHIPAKQLLFLNRHGHIKPRA